jgi:VWFA-related protein
LTVVLVLDDLSFSTGGRNQVRGAVEHFIDGQMQPRDLASIVRTAGGTGALQQRTSDKRMLHTALDVTNRQPAATAGVPDLKRDESLADITRGILRMVIEGLRTIPGRKAVVLFSENRNLYRSPQGLALVGVTTETTSNLLAARANRSSVVFYTVDPRGLAAAPSGQTLDQMEAYAGIGGLARDTGGIFFDNTNDAPTAMARVLQDQEGYYRIDFSRDEPADAPSGGQLLKGIVVNVKRPGLHVRSRREFPRGIEREAIEREETPLTQLLPPPPFASGGIHLRLTPLVSYAAASSLELLLQIDANDLTFSGDSKGIHSAGLEVAAAAFAPSGGEAGRNSQTYAIQIPGARFDRGSHSEGFTVSVRLPVRTPGPLQVHLAMRDATSGRVGSARQFVDFPDFASGQLLISGIVLSGAPDSEPKEPGENAAVRVFKAGRAMHFTYAIYNARVDAEKRSRLEIRIRVLREGEEIYAGDAVTASSAADPDPARRVRMGSMLLRENARPGRYTLELTATDSATAPPRTATQSIDFEVAAPK